MRPTMGPASGVPLFQAATADFNPFGGGTKLDSKNPDRGPLLIIAGTDDNTVPLAITDASYKIQAKNPASPRSSRSQAAETHWSSTAVGRAWQNPHSASSNDSCNHCLETPVNREDHQLDG